MFFKRAFLPLLSCAVLSFAAESVDAVPAAACHAGGFTVIGSPAREILPKADSNFNVTLDAEYYQGNGFDEALRKAMEKWSTVTGSNWRFNFSGYSNAISDQDCRRSTP